MPPELKSFLVLPQCYKSKIWLCENGTSEKEMMKARERTHFIPIFQFPLKIAREDYFFHCTLAMLAPKAYENLYACEGLKITRTGSVYDPDAYNPNEGKFIMGLQFHPERMRQPGSEEFDYPGCPKAYQEFVKAVIAYQKKVNSFANLSHAPKANQELENRRKIIMRSFSLAKNLYDARLDMPPSKEQDLEAGAEFLESNMALSLQQEERLKQMGATVRNSSSYMQKMKMNAEKAAMARKVMQKMSIEQLSELLSFYDMMGQICSDLLEKKLNSTP